MANFIRCKDCDHEVSPKAKTCPHCGAPIKQGASCIGMGCLGGLLVVLILAAIGAIIDHGNDDSPLSLSETPFQDKDNPDEKQMKEIQKPDERASADSYIQKAQQALKQAGYDPGPIDGIMGNRTRHAITKYQKDEKMEITGELDAPTRIKLYASLVLSDYKAKSLQLRQVCKATVATQNSRDPRIMKTRDDPMYEVVYVSYVRDDGVKWDYKCRYGQGNRILAKNINSPWNPNFYPRSWYWVDSGNIRIKSDLDGMINEKTYRLSDLDD